MGTGTDAGDFRPAGGGGLAVDSGPPGGEPGADGAAVYPSGQRDPWHGPLEAQNHGGAADGRAIVDHMATLHKKNTLCPAHKALEGRPNMYIHFRTEDSYQVVALQVDGGQRRGVSYPRDGGGLALAAQVLQPQDLEAYVLAQIHGALSGESL